MVLRNLDMFVWASGFHNPLVHTDFNMFVDEWTSANKIPGNLDDAYEQDLLSRSD